MTHPIWPLFDLRVTTGNLELRLPTDEDLVDLAAVVAKGVHDPAYQPFTVPWTRAKSPDLERNLLKYHWGLRANTGPSQWALEFVAVVDGAVVGVQGMKARDFAVRRTISSGSFLGLEHQGVKLNGIGTGTRMRAAMLELAFGHFDALRAETGARHDNAASIGVTKKLGYQDDGVTIENIEGERVVFPGFSLSKAGWRKHRRSWGIDDLAVTGLDAVLDFLDIEVSPNLGITRAF